MVWGPIIIGAVVYCWKFIMTLISTWQEVERGNSVPVGRDEKVGEVDEHGFKQVGQEVAPNEVKKDTPVGIQPDKIVVVSGEGKLEPAKPEPIPGKPTADEVLNDLDEAIKEEEKNG